MNLDNKKILTAKYVAIRLEDPSHNIWRTRSRPLDAIFKPKTVAVIGATEKEDSVGRAVIWNLIQPCFKGRVFPINPKRPAIFEKKAYPDIQSVPEPVDLAVIATPAATVLDLVKECAAAHVKGLIIISAGFKELGESGAALERQVVAEAKKTGMRVIGPNCLGIMNPVVGLNATFAGEIALPGHVGFISQSGALGTAVLDWSLEENVGFSSFISAGSMADIGWGDLIDYLGDDPETHSILIYMESIGDARDFLSAAREVALTKPVIVLKAGRTQAAAKAAISHTGSIAGSDEVLEAAFERSGVLRVTQIGDLFDLADILSKQPRPKGPKLAIVTNAGGPGVLATDALVEAGGQLAEIKENAYAALNAFLPPQWSHNNPIDVLGDADAERYAKTLEVLSTDPDVDGLLVILTPQAMTDATKTAEVLKAYAKIPDRPILASWMGAEVVKQGKKILTCAGIPFFPYPDEAARLFQSVWKYSENLKALYETPVTPSRCALAPRVSSTGCHEIIAQARRSHRVILTEFESKKLLASYGIPVVETYAAYDEKEALEWAEKIGYPVVVKLHSETITHKSDIGGVRLDLKDAAAVRAAFKAICAIVTDKKGAAAFQGVTVQPMVPQDGYELILGSSLDAQLGPMILFGAGGKLVEIFHDHAIAIPPLTTTLARRMMDKTKISKVLHGVRGERGVDLALVTEILVQFSELVVEQRWIKEIDINPFLVSPDRCLALDARIVLHDMKQTEDQLPKLAIRPYPVEYVNQLKMKDGQEVLVRPIRPEDEPLLVKFHHQLSEQSIYRRYFRSIGLSDRIAHRRLINVCFNDYDREIALVADIRDPEKGEHEILAVARLSRLHGTEEALFSMIIADSFQHRGLGTKLLRLILEAAKMEKIKKVMATTHPDNAAMKKIFEKAGFDFHTDRETGLILAEFNLS
ncbi:MAG: acetyl CoA synthetase subunit alpha [Candidatus Omnitrophica bacterium CG07_land_8_20_14_0_80_50_8]|nr:MAG: acetyl CoA synthetase subunit alpha [Candidatus Omnitrophica bacterium CG07_land_8_20_14_0_80_50_8]